MSEPSSLFLSVRITQLKLTEFLNSAPEKPVLDNNWSSWWNSREMYGKNDLSQEDMYCYSDVTNEATIKGWIESDDWLPPGAFSDYKNGVWNFGIIFFSQNYFDMIPMSNFIKSLGKYVEESTDNFAIIYPLFWGDDAIDAYLRFENGQTLFDCNVNCKEDVNPVLLTFANNYLSKKKRGIFLKRRLRLAGANINRGIKKLIKG